MNIHEYQAKALLRDYGAPVSDGRSVTRAEEAKTAAGELDGPLWVVKAQIHAGGRGKGTFKEADAGDKGGVRLARSVEEAATEAKRMLGRTLVTKQTGAGGKQVNRIYIEDGAGIDREMYLALLVDRGSSRISFVASTEGGMDIEEVAAKTPERIVSFSVDPATGYQSFHGRRIAFALGLEGSQVKQCVALMGTLYRLFVDKDVEMLEINPLIVTDRGDLKCLDAKMGFDGNAIYRHPDIAALRDETEEDPKELAASKYDLNYIALDGEIGCMVNGAGLAMATMDIIKLYGAEPANFLDVGGGATKEKVTEAFKIITSDPQVKGILVNIFGGIMRCDVIAEGVIAAVKEVGLQVPLVVRLEGTNVEQGKEILNGSDVNVIAADSLSDGAEKIVKAVKGRLVALIARIDPPLAVAADGTAVIHARPYGKAEMVTGAETFLWTSEPSGGHALAARGTLVSSRIEDVANPSGEGSHKELVLTVAITDRDPARTLLLEAIMPQRDAAAGPAEAVKVLYRHALYKITSIGSEAADFVRSHFEGH